MAEFEKSVCTIECLYGWRAVDIIVGGVGGRDGDIDGEYVGLLPHGGVSTSIVMGQIAGP